MSRGTPRLTTYGGSAANSGTKVGYRMDVDRLIVGFVAFTALMIA